MRRAAALAGVWVLTLGGAWTEPPRCSLQESFNPLRGPYMGLSPPGRPMVFLPGKISTGADEGSSIFFPGARSFLWMTRRSGQDSLLWLEDRQGRWQPPRQVHLVGRAARVRDFTIAPDGRWIYFTSNTETTAAGGDNIWRVPAQPERWSNAEILPDAINTDLDEGYPSVAREGRVYFFRRGAEDPSDSDLWAGRAAAEGVAAVRLASPVNGPFADFDPFVDPDEKYLLFASRRPGGFGGSDLYISHRDPRGGWRDPVNLGPAVNSSADEARPAVTIDGRCFFFTSTRLGPPELPPGMPPAGSMPGNGSSDIWWMSAAGLPLEPRGSSPGGSRPAEPASAGRRSPAPSAPLGTCGPTTRSGHALRPYLGQDPPGERPAVFAPGVISDAGERLHGTPVFSPDLAEAYWAVVPPRILVMKERDGVWTGPEPLPLAAEGPQAPCLSPDGRRLYFQARRPDGRGGVDLWWADRTGDGWGTPRNLDSPVNTPRLEAQPSLSAWGTLYFTGHLEDAWMQRGIYRAERRGDGFSPPELLPSSINSPFLDYTPYIDPCERYLLFASSRPKRDEAGLHLLVAYRLADGSWSPPANLSAALGLTEAARFPTVSPDGRFLFYLSGTRIYWVDFRVLERLRPRAAAPGPSRPER